MDAYTCIISKRDTRAYVDRPIPPEALRRILQAGRMAGSAKNLQPCRFVVVQEEAQAEVLVEVQVQTKFLCESELISMYQV